MKSGRDETSEESQAFLKPSVSDDGLVHPIGAGDLWKKVTRYLRILLEIAMASSLALLLFFRASSTNENLRRSPVPQCKLVFNITRKSLLTV
jgi:hypothetical protein